MKRTEIFCDICGSQIGRDEGEERPTATTLSIRHRTPQPDREVVKERFKDVCLPCSMTLWAAIEALLIIPPENE